MTGSKQRIGLREVRNLSPDETIWDERIPGFCARRRKSQAVFYGLKYRTNGGRQRWHTIGRHGAPWTPDSARDEARRVLAEVASGRDIAAEKSAYLKAETVSDLCDRYLKAATEGRLLTRRGQSKKHTTLKTDRSRIEAHIRPLLGSMKVSEVDRADIEQFMHEVADGKSRRRSHLGKPRSISNVRGGKGAASRTIGLLGAMFTYALRVGIRKHNPVTGIVRFADGQKQRRLSGAEYRKLGEGTAAAEKIWPPAIAAARFLALSGWRSGEVLNLRWTELDLERRTARLADTKTGGSTRALSFAAVRELESLPRGKPADLVFPSVRRVTAMSGFPSVFSKIIRLACLSKDVTPHFLRHSFASVAADLGFSELTIGALIGHRGASVTSRYTHHADAVLLSAADQVASHIFGLMWGCSQDEQRNVLQFSRRELAAS